MQEILQAVCDNCMFLCNMPRALVADWEQAKLLRAQGLEYSEISKMLGISVTALTTRASREGWSKKIGEVRDRLQVAVTERLKATLEERAARFVDAMVDDVEESTDALRKLKPGSSIRALKEREDVAGALLKRGRLALGLDKDQSSTSINVFLSGAEQPLAERPAVEVEVQKLPDA